MERRHFIHEAEDFVVFLPTLYKREGVTMTIRNEHALSDIPQALFALGPISLRDGGVNLGWMTHWSIEQRTPSYAITTQEAIEMGTARTILVIEYVGGTKDEFEGEAADLLLSHLQDRAEPMIWRFRPDPPYPTPVERAMAAWSALQGEGKEHITDVDFVAIVERCIREALLADEQRGTRLAQSSARGQESPTTDEGRRAVHLTDVEQR
jgi:hypothetical protein